MRMPFTLRPNLNLTTLRKESVMKEAQQILFTTHNSTVLSSIRLNLLPTRVTKSSFSQVKQIHSLINHRGLSLAISTIFQNNLMNMYVKSGNCVDAHKVFDEMTERDVSSWNTMISAYRRRGYPRQALALFHQMQKTGLQPDRFTFSSILQACAKMRALKQGINTHQGIMERGFFSDVVIVNTLIDMYTKCGSVHKARELFDKMPQRSVISWNSMIAGYAQNGVLDKALRLFNEMPEKNVVSWNAVIAGCVQNGEVDLALKFFKEMPRPDVISWNAIVAGYARYGLVEKAMETFKQIRLLGLKPNSSTFASILPACAKMGALEQGMDIHQGIIECGFMSDVVVVSALVDMYAKCGSIQKARELFDKMTQRNVISWNAMVAGYAQNGFSQDALKLFELMKQSAMHPDHVSFACVLFACSHAGLVDQGCKYFNDMTATYCITPMIDHYVCLVDLLGRAGYLEEGLNIIIKMPIKPMVVVWICLLGACRSHKSIELGVFTANLLFELDPINTATYVPLSNIYAELGRWDEVQRVRKLMKDRGIIKTPGCSWIEVHKVVHSFCVRDKSHPQAQEIYAKLETLSQTRESGFLPDVRHILNDVQEK